MNLSTLARNAQKFLVAASGAVAEAVSLGLLHGTPERWVTGVISVATAFLVYAMPNGARPAAKHATAKLAEQGPAPLPPVDGTAKP